MSAQKYFDNGLNVTYIKNFFQTSEADRYFEQLLTLPFFTPTLKIWGKEVNPKRKVLAYGDADAHYSFSGAEIPTESWTPLMLELRRHVEEYAGCTYNYVLLNYYADGTNYISHHKDNETSLDSTFPIAVLSFGEKRLLEFKRPNFKPTSFHLEHGSLYLMGKPTNELFTHGIPQDASLKKPRISLTFRHLICQTPLKKPRLDLDLMLVSPVQNELDDEPSTSCEKTKCETFIENNQVTLHNELLKKNNEHSKQTLNQNTELVKSDWLTKFYQQVDKPDPVFLEWSLNWNTYVQVICENNSLVRLQIRNFKEDEKGFRYPTKSGIIMTPQTWDHFYGKLINFDFYSVNDSFISNNQLIVFFIDEENCLLQQVFDSKQNGFFLKPHGIKLSKDQFLRLDNFKIKITDCLIEAILTRVIPNLILNRNNTCLEHVSVSDAKQNFLSCFKMQLSASINAVFYCTACELSHPSQFDHYCVLLNMYEKFILCRNSALLHFNTTQFVTKLFTSHCTCQYNDQFFQTMDMYFYNDYFDVVFPRNEIC